MQGALLNAEDIVRTLVSPSSLLAIIFALGVVSLLFRATGRLARYFLVTGLLGYIILASGPVSFGLLGNLEYRYKMPGDALGRNDAESIVVLAAYGERDPLVPESSHLNAASVFRLLEAVRIYRHLPSRRIILSGEGETPVIMRSVLLGLGIDGARIDIDVSAPGTADSARHLRPILGQQPFFLVTSAGHMPRAMYLFSRLGGSPIPAPTHFLTRQNYLATSYLPSPEHLRLTDLAVTEYVALLKEKWASKALSKSN